MADDLQQRLDETTAELDRLKASITLGTQRGTEIGRVSVKNVPFFRDDPNLYFIQIEAQFQNAGITVDQTKYNHVIAQFEPKYLSKVSDLLRDPPATGKYDELKKRILNEFTDSDQKKLKKLIEGIELGDDKPTHLLKRMKDLAGSALSDDAIKTLFVQRLPETVRGIISIAEGDSTVWAKQADKMMETTHFSNIAAVGPNDKFQTEIELLRKQVASLQTSRGRNHSRTNSKSRNNSKSKPPGDKNKTHQVCFYHFRFGEKARNCKEPCDYAEKPIASEN